MQAVPQFSSDQLTVIPWDDHVADQVGHDPRSRYVETYWLSVLGPSSTWLLRKFADELEASPSGFTMDVAETAKALGVGGTGKNSPFIRTLGRLVQFEMARIESPNVLAVRRRIPSLSRRHVMRLTDTQQASHYEWQKQRLAGCTTNVPAVR